MPGYIPTTLYIFQHKSPACNQDAPHSWNKPVYRKHIQLDTQHSAVPKLNFINDLLLYYSSAVYLTIIPDIKEIYTYQYAPTQDTME